MQSAETSCYLLLLYQATVHGCLTLVRIAQIHLTHHALSSNRIEFMYDLDRACDALFASHALLADPNLMLLGRPYTRVKI